MLVSTFFITYYPLTREIRVGLKLLQGSLPCHRLTPAVGELAIPRSSIALIVVDTTDWRQFLAQDNSAPCPLSVRGYWGNVFHLLNSSYGYKR